MRTVFFSLLPFCLAAQPDTIQWGAREVVMTGDSFILSLTENDCSTYLETSKIVLDSQTLTLKMVFENVEVTNAEVTNAAVAEEGIVLHPAPGYRTYWCYWGGRWYAQDDYLRTPGIGCRCVLRYFDNGEHNAVWLENINLPDYRMKRILELADCDSLLAIADQYRGYDGDWTDLDKLTPVSIKFYSPDSTGDFPVGYRVNLQFAMERARWAILESRKKK